MSEGTCSRCGTVWTVERVALHVRGPEKTVTEQDSLRLAGSTVASLHEYDLTELGSVILDCPIRTCSGWYEVAL